MLTLTKLATARALQLSAAAECGHRHARGYVGTWVLTDSDTDTLLKFKLQTCMNRPIQVTIQRHLHTT